MSESHGFRAAWVAELAALDELSNDASRAIEVAEGYARLAKRIDPSTAAGTERVRFVLAHLPRTERAPLDLFDRTARRSPDTDLAARAAVAWSSVSIALGDIGLAEERLWEVLRHTRGTDTATERGACVNLSRALAKQSRAQEALLVSGRAYAISGVLGDPIGLAAAGLASASALVAMGEATEALARMDEAQECLEGIDHPAADALRRTGRSQRLSALHIGARYDDALALAREYESLTPDRSQADRAWYSAFRARVHLDAGRIDEAERNLVHALESAEPGDKRTLSLRVVETRIQHARGDVERTRTSGRLAVDAAEALEPRYGHARFRLSLLVSILRSVDERELAQRCAELAAAERLQQIIAVDRCARDIPEFCLVRREDRELLVQARKRFVDQQRECLAELSTMLRAGDGSAAADVLTPEDDGLVRVCAWCTRVATVGGRWLPLGHLLPPAGELQVTHGMCETCRDRMAAPARGSAR